MNQDYSLTCFALCRMGTGETELCLEHKMELNDINLNDMMDDINMEYDARKSGGSKARQGVVRAKKKYHKRNMKNTNEERLSRKEVNYAKDNARKGAFKPRCRTEYPPPKKYRDKKGRKKGTPGPFCRPSYVNRFYQSWEVRNESKMHNKEINVFSRNKNKRKKLNKCTIVHCMKLKCSCMLCL